MSEKQIRNHEPARSSYPRGEVLDDGNDGATGYGYIDDLKAATAELAGLMEGMKEYERSGVDAELARLRGSATLLHEAYYNGESSQSLAVRTKEEVLQEANRLLATEDLSDAQLRECLDTVGEIARYGEAYKPWNMLRLVDKDRLQGGVADKLLAAGANSDIVKRGEMRSPFTGEIEQDEGEYANFIQLADYACSKDGYGSFVHWRQGDKVAAPPFVEDLVEDERFLPACVDIMKKELEGNKNILQRDWQARNFEHFMLSKMIGLPKPRRRTEPDMANEFQVAFSARSMSKDEKGRTIPYEAGGGVNLDYWSEKLKKYTRNVETIGVEQAVRLRKELGFVNFDRYDDEQLHLMIDVLDGSPEIQERLRKNEVTILITDSTGDHNGANDTMPEKARNVAEYDKHGEKTGDVVLYAEMSQRSDIYRHPIKIYNACGARSSNLIIASHGAAAEGISVAHVVEEAVNERGEKVEAVRDIRLTREIVAQAKSKGRFFEKYMKPGKESGERNVVAISCSQAIRPDDSDKVARLLRGERMQNVQLRWEDADKVDPRILMQIIGKSMLDVAAATTDPDVRVAFNAAPFVASYTGFMGNLFAWRGGSAGKEVADTLTARRRADGSVELAPAVRIPLNKKGMYDQTRRAA